MTPTRPPTSGAANLRLFAVISITSVALVLQFALLNGLLTQAAPFSVQRSYKIPLFNPAPGGRAPEPQRLSGYTAEALPTLTTISPASATAGIGPLILTVNGSNISADAIVKFNGIDRPTTFVSATQLTTQLTSEDLAAPDSFVITVFKPPPGGGISNAINFNVLAPVVGITSISPSGAPAGAPAFTLTVNGNNFFNGIVVRWNGSDRATTFVSSVELTAEILAADIQNVGTAAVTIYEPGSGVSPAINFTISCACGYEGDVNGNGSISISDWVQIGRFAVGLNTPTPGCQFQRADIAPRATLGDGLINMADWVQMGRLAAGLDRCPVLETCLPCAGGPDHPLQSGN